MAYRQEILDLSEKYYEQLQRSEQKGELILVAAAMAHALQMQLEMPGSPVRHAGALETIMRAVAHAIEGNPEMDNYVLEKLGHGHDCLKSWISQGIK